ncbi:ATP-dependent Lon protease [Thaumasiovibrio subtropicus]|uniref:ATP-dependent Lon protease n=1 Tax=Thaumasiovibrio subtropicus TaxID=1891207 RepID=UPI000B354AAD|nr:ATP-dependent Lon protease [Thaumasiovibrio subtropicus]
MIVSPTVTGAPIIAPTVNVPTEQVARDNRVREKIVPTTQTAESASEKAPSSEEKQLKKPAWDPSEHPTYNETPIHKYDFRGDTELDRLIEVLSAGSYFSDDTSGYTMRVKLPRDVFEKLEQFNASNRIKGVVTHHYATSSVPNPPIQYLVII